eukprot:UN13974
MFVLPCPFGFWNAALNVGVGAGVVYRWQEDL